MSKIVLTEHSGTIHLEIDVVVPIKELEDIVGRAVSNKVSQTAPYLYSQLELSKVLSGLPLNELLKLVHVEKY